MKAAAVLAMIVFGTASAQAPPADIRARLESAEQLWNSIERENYEYKLIRGGAFGYSEYTVRFRGGFCSARMRFVFGKPEPWKRASCDDVTMPALFKEMRVGLHCDSCTFELEVDAATGHVIHFQAEPPPAEKDGDIADGGWYVKLTEFKSR